MALPNITDIAALSKRKRKERDVLMSCYDTLVGIDATDSAKVPKATRECWLVAKFGLEKNMAATKLVEAVPEALQMHKERKLYLILKTQ